MKVYRQGDVLLRKVSEMPEECKREKGLVLAEGKVTGHAHRIVGTGATLYATPDQRRYLEIKDFAFVKHEEHGEIRLPSGCYEVIRQVEYTPERIRYVAD